MPFSQAKRAGNDRYNAKCDYISIRPLKERGAEIRAAAEASKMSLQGWILQACAEKIQRDSERG